MAEEGLRLVLGLGNPGPRYAATRHNIGFRVLDRLAEAFGIEVGREKFGAAWGRGRIHGVEVVLAKPLEYMNCSGPPARRIADFFRIAGPDAIVIHDDIDLEFGRLHIKAKGGHGGHNGVRSLIESFGHGDFVRVRVGIGRTHLGGRPVADYVLEPFSAEEQQALPGLIERAKDAVATILSKGVQSGMNQFNPKPPCGQCEPENGGRRG